MKHKVVILLSIGSILSILISCFSTEHYLIKNIEFEACELTNPGAKDEDMHFISIKDTMKDRLFFAINCIYEHEYGFLKSNPLLPSCYATSVPKKMDNYIMMDEIELCLDGDIYFENDTIVAGTNLWNHASIKEYKWERLGGEYGGVSTRFLIGFTDALHDKLRIPPKNYTIELTCKTNDGLVLVDRLEIYVSI